MGQDRAVSDPSETFPSLDSRRSRLMKRTVTAPPVDLGPNQAA